MKAIANIITPINHPTSKSKLPAFPKIIITIIKAMNTPITLTLNSRKSRKLWKFMSL